MGLEVTRGRRVVFSNRTQNDPLHFKWGSSEYTGRRTHVNRVRVGLVGDIAVVVAIVVVVITAAAVVVHEPTSVHETETNASDPLVPVVWTHVPLSQRSSRNARRRRNANDNQTGCWNADEHRRNKRTYGVASSASRPDTIRMGEIDGDATAARVVVVDDSGGALSPPVRGGGADNGMFSFAVRTALFFVVNRTQSGTTDTLVLKPTVQRTPSISRMPNGRRLRRWFSKIILKPSLPHTTHRIVLNTVINVTVIVFHLETGRL